MKLEENLEQIYTAAIEAVNPKSAIKSHLKLKENELVLYQNNQIWKEFNLYNYKRIFVVGAGKATAPMALAVEEILGDKIEKGVISVKYGYTENLKKIEMVEASHPIPDLNSVVAASKIKELLEETKEDDLVISLISGGGSALLALPVEGVTLEEKGKVTNLLIKSGASIDEINSVRKHLSLVKGGGLAFTSAPATVLNLMISDVVGDKMDVIASGPFVFDSSSFTFAIAVIEKYNLWDQIPKSVKNYLEKGKFENISEKSSSNDKIFDKIYNLIIASNIQSLKAAKIRSEKLGYKTLILSSMIEGDTSETANWHLKIMSEIISSNNPIGVPACIISGGETTVKVNGDGLGGRNMEFALQSVVPLDGISDVIVASIGTDGTDGPTDAAGAFVTGKTLSNSKKLNVPIKQYLSNNDAYHFFEKVG